jgi:zinc protease
MSVSFPRPVAACALVALLGAAPSAPPSDLPSPAPSAAPVAAPASNDASAVTRATLANGLRVVVVRDPLAPVVTVYVNYEVGGDETPPGFPGMAHAQEHMAFRGCANLAPDQISAIFAQLGGDGDADTQQTITQYYATIPSADLDVVLNVDAACMRDIVDSQKEWNGERPAIEQEVASDNSNPGYKAITRLGADMFAGTPYAHDPLGTRPSFNETTGAMLKKFYRTWYAPNNAILVIAGDVDPAATISTVRRLYGSIPRRPVPARPAVNLQPVKSESFTLDSDLPYALAYTAYRMPGSDDPDYAAANILMDVLASQRADIYGLTVQGKALQSGAELGASYPKSSLGIVYGALGPKADVNAFDAELARIVANYAANGVPADLVDAAKRSEIAANEYSRNSISDLAATWSDALAAEGRQSPDDDVAAIAKVTPDDVDRVAKTYLQPSLAVTANLVPRPSGNAVSSKGFGGGETLTSQPTKPVTLPPFARAKLAQLAVAPSTLRPTDTLLPNGVRLIVQPENASDTVTVLGSIKHEDDLQTAPGKEGVNDVLSGLFSYGTTSLDRLAFQKALDDIAAQASAGTEFSLHVLRANFDDGVRLLADDELHPALPADAFNVVKQQTAQAVAGTIQSPGYLTQRAIDTALLPPGDPDLREATPQTIEGLGPGDVKAYENAVYRPDMTTIVVVGNITPAQAQATIEKYFGDWSATGPKPEVELPKVPLNKPHAAVVPDASRVQDETSLVETVDVTRNDPAYYALQLGDHVLGGGFYATRLYHDLRQVAGYVYDVDNRLEAGKTRATYTVTYGSDPQNVSKARRLIARDLHQMQTANVTAAELEQAKAILLRQLPLGEASEDDVASALARRSLAGLPLDEAHHAATIYASLDADAVRAAFAKYIRTSGFVQVVQGPNPS